MSKRPPLSRGRRRSAARLAAVQALYQMEFDGNEAANVVGQFETYRLGETIDGVPIVEADHELFGELVLGVTSHRSEIDGVIGELLVEGRTLAKLELILREILRAAAYEILKRPDIDPPLTISEYVDITTAFFANKEPDFVNSILDQLARKARAKDMGAASRGQHADIDQNR